MLIAITLSRTCRRRVSAFGWPSLTRVECAYEERSVLHDDPMASRHERFTAARDLIEIDLALRAVLGPLTVIGARPYLVGGCVRDAVLAHTNGDRPRPKDFDIEVYGRSLDDLQEALEAAGLRVDAVGKQFGVLKVRIAAADFDVSVPRRDSKTGSGHRGF